VSHLKDKGILTEADIEQIESRATEQFAEDIQIISEEDAGS
jgi:TPP-dependent pyruvate/acetoin dehydrogenase alpha subunit